MTVGKGKRPRDPNQLAKWIVDRSTSETPEETAPAKAPAAPVNLSEYMAAIGKKGGERVSQNREHMAAIGKKGGERVSQNREHMASIGRKGGEAVSQDREHMSRIGRIGGKQSAGRFPNEGVADLRRVGQVRPDEDGPLGVGGTDRRRPGFGGPRAGRDQDGRLRQG